MWLQSLLALTGVRDAKKLVQKWHRRWPTHTTGDAGPSRCILTTMRKPAVSLGKVRAEYRFPVIVIREKRDYWAYVPDLPGVYGRGKTPASAKKDLAQALKLYIEDCVAAGDPVPTSAAEIVNASTLSIAAGA